MKRRSKWFFLSLLMAMMGCVSVSASHAQVPAALPATPPPSQPAIQEPVPDTQPKTPGATVLFQSHGAPPTPAVAPADGVPLSSPSATPAEAPAGQVPDVSDRERSVLVVSAYDLDVRLRPRSAGLAARAQLTATNSGTDPLRRVPLQVSSTLHWESVGLLDASGRSTPLEFVQHGLDTDTDHTGSANEAIVTLSAPLAPGASVRLDAFYSGTLAPSTGRLQRLGASAEQAAAADWDGVVAPGTGRTTALRGFGNVLWYPVISPQLFLGEGNELFRAVGMMRKRDAGVSARLRVSVDYSGEPPTAVYFCGRRQAFVSIPDTANEPVAAGSGLARAEFSAAAIGFRTPSLFLVEHPETLLAPLPQAGTEGKASAPGFSSSAAPNQLPASPLAGDAFPDKALPVNSANDPAPDRPMLAVETDDDSTLPALEASAERVAPLLAEWFGARPPSALTVIDHRSQPFGDGPLLVAPVGTLAASTAEGALVHSLAAAWVQTGQPWMDEGLPQFAELLWTERERGRDAAIAQLTELMQPVSLAEPALERPGEAPIAGAVALPQAAANPPGQSLVEASDDLFYRRKAAAVWWMLRDAVGEESLRLALNAWLTQPASKASPRETALAFERLVEKTSGKEVGWLFADWVLRDRGLPDLTLTDVTPRQLPAGQGHDSGWLVAVTVRNDGAATAEVPVVIRSGTFSTTKRMRIAGFATATERVLVEAPPTEVAVNDGGTPEVRSSTHTRTVVTHGP